MSQARQEGNELLIKETRENEIMLDAMFKREKVKSMKQTLDFTLGNYMKDPERDQYLMPSIIKDCKQSYAQWYKI